MKNLSFAEDLCLLLLNEQSGSLLRLPGHSTRFGFATATLLELAHENRIDADLDNLVLLDASPLGDRSADLALGSIAQSENPHSPEYWIRRLGLQQGNEIQEHTLDKLCQKGILERTQGDCYFLAPEVARSRRYPGVSGTGGDEIRLRVMRTLFSDDIPSPYEASLIGLVQACGAFKHILSTEELERVSERIESVKAFELLCHAAEKLIVDGPKERAARKTYKPIPEVPGLPLLGSALNMTGDLNAFLLGLYRRHGPICRLRVLGRQYFVMGGRDANLWVTRNGREHLRGRKQFAAFCDGMETDRAMISMDGEEHMKLRRVAKAGYGRAVFERGIDTAVEIVRRNVASWPTNRPMETFATMQRLVTEHVGVLATGHSPLNYIDDLKYFFDSLVFSVRRDRPKFMYAYRFRRVRERIRQLHSEVLELHQPELRDGLPRDLIDEFLELNRQNPQFLPETDLMSAVIGPYIAALDTVAGTLGFGILKLLSEPKYKEMLKAEADAAFANGMPTAKDIRALQATNAFATEVLRCYPIVPVLMRTACNSFEFNGHHVPAGSDIIVAMTVAHGDEALFPNPEKFELERHLPPRAEYYQKGAFAPFGVGTHTCLGNGFAMAQIVTTLATMLHFAEFERVPANDGRIKISSYPTIRPHKRCKFQLVRHIDRELGAAADVAAAG